MVSNHETHNSVGASCGVLRNVQAWPTLANCPTMQGGAPSGRGDGESLLSVAAAGRTLDHWSEVGIVRTTNTFCRLARLVPTYACG